MKTNNQTTVMTYAITRTIDKVNKTNYNPLNIEKKTVSPLDEIKTLMEKRNAIITALAISDLMLDDFNEINATICDKMSVLAVKKKLEFLQNNNSHLPSSSLEVIDELINTLFFDISTMHHWKLDENFGDNIPLYDIAYVTIYKYLEKRLQFNFNDIVLTYTTSKSEHNYNIYQSAKKAVEDDIHSWSTTKGYDLKKLGIIIGYDDNDNEIITSDKRKIREYRKANPDTLEDIPQSTKTAFFNRYGLTAKQQEIMLLYIKGENTKSIANLLNLSERTVREHLQLATAKFKTASLYEEYLSAKASEEYAKAKAEKHETDKQYQGIYNQAQERTKTAYVKWKKAFREDMPKAEKQPQPQTIQNNYIDSWLKKWGY